MLSPTVINAQDTTVMKDATMQDSEEPTKKKEICNSKQEAQENGSAFLVHQEIKVMQTLKK